jgi:hypothetical protein
MLDRYDALVALRETAVEKKRSLLLDALKKETFHQLKTEIVNQLIPDAASAESIRTVFTQSAPSPKLAAIRKCSGSDEKWKQTCASALKDSSYDVVQAALEKLCKTWPGEAATWLDATKDVDGMGNAVRIKWLELAYQHSYNVQASLDELIAFAGNAWEFRTRNNAFTSLKNLGICDERVVAHLMDAMLNTNSRLASPAAQLAEHFALQTGYRNLFINYYTTKVSEPWQKELLKKQLSFLPTN